MRFENEYKNREYIIPTIICVNTIKEKENFLFL